MKRLLIICAVLALCWPVGARAADKGCEACHQGFVSPMPANDAHKLACTECHGGDSAAADAGKRPQGNESQPLCPGAR